MSKIVTGSPILQAISDPVLNNNVETLYQNSLDLSSSISFSYFENKMKLVPKEITISLAEFRKRVITPELCNDKDSAPLLSPAIYKPEEQRIENVDEKGHPIGIKGRQNANVQSWGLCPLDFDHQKEHPRKFLQPLIDAGLTFDAVPTFSNRKVCGKNSDGREYFYRVFLYVNRPIPADKQPVLWSAVRALTGNRIDVSAKALAQMFFIPLITSPDERLEIYTNEDSLLDWVGLLEKFEQEQNLNKLNSTPTHTSTPTQVASKQVTQIDHPTFRINSIDRANFEYWNRLLAEGYSYEVKDGELTIEYPCTCLPEIHNKGSKTSGLCKFGQNGIIRITCNAQIGKGMNDPKAILATRNIILEPAEKETNLNNLKTALPVGAFKMINAATKEKGKPKEFYFDSRIVRGFLNGLYGEDKLKKSQIIVSIVSQLSLSGIKCLYFTSEDDADTVIERLSQFSHNPEFIEVLDRRFILNADGNLDKLRCTIKEHGAGFVGIDAIDDFIDGKTDTRSSTKVRDVLAELNDIAKETNCAIVIVGHTTKDTKNTNARTRIMNSAAFKSACRSILFVARNPNNPENEGILAHMDSSYGPKAKSLTYLLGAVKFQWTGESDVTADNVLIIQQDVDKEDKSIILDTLIANDGVMRLNAITVKLKDHGISPQMIKNWRLAHPKIVDKAQISKDWYVVLLRDGKTARQIVIDYLNAQNK